MPTTSVPPCIRLRTALMITLTGWLAAKGCIQPGIDSTGTLALEMNENGITSIDMPCAAWALPETRPMRDEHPGEGVAGDQHEQEAERRSRPIAAVGPEADDEAERRR